MVGRDAELGRLPSLWGAAQDGQGQVVVVQAEAGAGKSRLVAELVGELVAEGVPVAQGRRRRWPPRRRTPGGVTCGPTCSASTRAHADRRERAVERLDPRLVARAPLLGPLLGLSLPDSALTASFDGELRKTSLEDLLGGCSTPAPRSGASSGRRGRALARPALARPPGGGRPGDAGGPVLLVVTSRPDGTALAGLPVGAPTTSPTWCWRRWTRRRRPPWS